MNLEEVVSQIHSNQQTIMKQLDKLDKALYGDQSNGLLFEHIECRGQVKDLLWLRNLMLGSVLTVFLSILGSTYNLHQTISRLDTKISVVAETVRTHLKSSDSGQ